MDRRKFIGMITGSLVLAPLAKLLPRPLAPIKQIPEHFKPGLQEIVGTKLSYRTYSAGFTIKNSMLFDDIVGEKCMTNGELQKYAKLMAEQFDNRMREEINAPTQVHLPDRAKRG